METKITQFDFLKFVSFLVWIILKVCRYFVPCLMWTYIVINLHELLTLRVLVVVSVLMMGWERWLRWRGSGGIDGVEVGGGIDGVGVVAAVMCVMVMTMWR